MTILCVDDEELILGLTASMCEEIPGAEVVGKFQKASDALAYIKEHAVDIVLLDINMPEMDGLTLAAKIKELRPEIAVIFLTGYEQYALDAFALHATGYLLKPVSKKRLTEEISYAISMRDAREKENSHIVVQTFGEFDVFVDGKIVSFKRARAKELLAYLVDRQGSSITRAAAFAVLWEDEPYDRPMQKQLDVVIRSLMATLEEYGISEIFELHKGTLRVHPETFFCDAYQFFEGDVNAVNAYRGEYMSAYSWASFTEAYMDRQNGLMG